MLPLLNEPPTCSSPPPVHCALCDGHQNITQTGKVNIRGRKIPNYLSAACTSHCTATKIEKKLYFMKFVHHNLC